MAWTIEYDRDATQAFKRLDKPVARDIMDYLDAVASLDDPRAQLVAEREDLGFQRGPRSLA
ncbi:hypothetical protein ART_0463 [Arthrobacter sp. PAMC 25486]|uniref:type II toxin-antitoxin system RelE family toxin n=1 Tax=Arthrobacter sp. PAMC 25486 TaxID=1494608 RepID=UPI000535D8EE|nr:hypothetical protein [Arthrobacter sp. PAMC 25486]AIY00062.1 hypothetical protein ART_0463 [Arthrobacter sp. PAMC 25486]